MADKLKAFIDNQGITSTDGASSLPIGQPAFDTAAPAYDAVFTHTRLGKLLRDAIWGRLAALFQAGDTVLELGCGTGEDAIWLAQRGVRVVATDVSAEMLEIARQKAVAVGVTDRIRFETVDLASVESADWTAGMVFDGVLSNFGALNCLSDRKPLAQWLSRCVRPGGLVALVVMGPFCPWEVGWHLLHGRFDVATRRFRLGDLAHVGNGRKVPVWYPSPRRLRVEFASPLLFGHRQTIGIGALLPPSYLSHLVDRWPKLFSRVDWLDRRLGRVFPWAWLSDHYLSVFERK